MPKRAALPPASSRSPGCSTAPFVTGVIAGPRTEEQWDDYVRALEYRFTAEDEALVDRLVVSGHPSTPGYNDPQYPIEGRKAAARRFRNHRKRLRNSLPVGGQSLPGS